MKKIDVNHSCLSQNSRSVLMSLALVGLDFSRCRGSVHFGAGTVCLLKAETYILSKYQYWQFEGQYDP